MRARHRSAKRKRNDWPTTPEEELRQPDLDQYQNKLARFFVKWAPVVAERDHAAAIADIELARQIEDQP